jgi:hypothetical protein
MSTRMMVLCLEQSPVPKLRNRNTRLRYSYRRVGHRSILQVIVNTQLMADTRSLAETYFLSV